MKRLLASLLLTVATFANAAPALTEQIGQLLARPAVLRGEFEQQRQVQGFSKPLVSRGSFVVARGRGVLWSTRTPFASQLVLTQAQIRATQDGKVNFQLDAAAEPAVRVINSVLFGLLDGDVAALSAHFKLEGQVDGKAWRLSLQPSDAALARMMSRIELEGDQYVRRIRIFDASGDRSTLVFSAQREDAALNTEEGKRLE